MNNDNFELCKLTKIFESGNRAFRIPDYQRGYSWESRQRNDLLKDIEYIIENNFDYIHFTGTIVASKNEEITIKNNLETYDIVDGQQRLTTIILLLAILGERLNKNNNITSYNGQDILENFIASNQDTGSTIRKFYSSIEQDEFFNQLIRYGDNKIKEIKSKSDQNLVDAYKELREWISDKNVENIAKCVLENLGFLFYAPKNDREIGIMFEVINNRGKPLSQLEKIKNYIIYYAEKNQLPDLKSQIMESWPHILNNLNTIGFTSNEKENTFLRNAWVVFGNTNKSQSYQVYDDVKSRWNPDDSSDWLKLKEFIRFLESASRSYTKIFHQLKCSYEEKLWLERIHLHPQNASMTPLILAIFERIESEEQRAQLFELLEKLNFRFYVCGIARRADSSQGSFFDWAHRLYNQFNQEDELGHKTDFLWLYKKIHQFINTHAPDSRFEQKLVLKEDEDGDFYHWPGLKFFLASYEEKLRNIKGEKINLREFLASRDPKSPNNFFHKEHIWAVKEYSVIDDREDLSINKRRLGNFILLKESQNIRVSNDRVEVKIKSYWTDRKNDPNTLMIRELNDIFNNATRLVIEADNRSKRTKKYWKRIYQQFLDLHEKRYTDFALKRWDVRDSTF